MDRRGIKKEQTVESMCFFLCAISMFYFVASKQYLYFVTPKMGYFLYFVAAVFAFWGMFALFHTKKRTYKYNLRRFYLLILISVILLLPYDHVESSNLSSTENIGINILSSDIKGDVMLPEKGKEIVVTEESFAPWVNELWNHVHEYEDSKIRIQGRLVKEKETTDQNKYTLIRLYMSCCAADVIPIGITCIVSDVASDYDGCWVEITGVVMCNHTESKVEPKIYVTGMKRLEEPDVEYIF